MYLEDIAAAADSCCIVGDIIPKVLGFDRRNQIIGIRRSD